MLNVMKGWDETCEYKRDLFLSSKSLCHFLSVDGLCTQTKVSVPKLIPILIATKVSMSMPHETESKNIIEMMPKSPWGSSSSYMRLADLGGR